MQQFTHLHKIYTLTQDFPRQRQWESDSSSAESFCKLLHLGRGKKEQSVFIIRLLWNKLGFNLSQLSFLKLT